MILIKQVVFFQDNFFNAKENKPRFKLFNINDTNWQDDMNAVEVLIKAVQKDEENEHVDTTTTNVRIRRRGIGTGVYNAR